MAANPNIPSDIDLDFDISSTVLSPILSMMVLAGLSVALRMTSTYSSRGSLQIDDYLILAALVVAWATGAVSIYASSEGASRQALDRLESFVKVLWACEFLYTTAITLTKLAIIFFYYRIFPVPAFRKILQIGVTLIVGWWIASIVVAIVQCRPYDYFWKQYTAENPEGTCIDIPSFYIGNGAVSVVTDLLILTTPIPMVWRLQMPVVQRLSVLGIFFVGIFVCIAGIIRIHLLKEIFKFDNLSWDLSQAFIWSSVEPHMGITCACAPTFRPLIRRWLPKWFGGSSARYGTDRLRQHSRTGDFYSLHDRTRNTHNTASKYDDELALTDDIPPLGTQQSLQNGTKDGITVHTQSSIMVRREIEWSSTTDMKT